jgi:hypothetical protein
MRIGFSYIFLVVETLVLTVSAANRGGEGYTSMNTKNNCREVGKDFPTVGVFSVRLF